MPATQVSSFQRVTAATRAYAGSSDIDLDPPYAASDIS